jgi:hypothetical protein
MNQKGFLIAVSAKSKDLLAIQVSKIYSALKINQLKKTPTPSMICKNKFSYSMFFI